jgi:hypothetical protein
MIRPSPNLQGVARIKSGRLLKGDVKVIKNLVIGVAIVMMLMTGIASAAATDKEQAAVVAAEQWLALVDAGSFTDSWTAGAEYFKGAVSQEKWDQALQAVRKPLGATISRKLKTKTYETSLPGAPDGEYVIIQYETSFQNKKSAIETLTPMLDKDGQWRVAGYFIK